MPAPQLYIIDYRLHDQLRSFIIRLERMDNAEAWHWASCDAGIGIIPKFGREKIRKVSRPMAERYGITDVRWRLSGTRENPAAPTGQAQHGRSGGEDVSNAGETAVIA
ncbi:DUF6555 family protein [Pseudomonas cremoricolorata]|uniref:DUF6555 family protein n=1 Tax=Pseudomonas cremoricolorata TaxID=157783 RepID=UPI00041CD8F7|nr:DUF6555 family protein [Pseudomonas cremoricolorata]